MENGNESITDPAMSKNELTHQNIKHPDLPDWILKQPNWWDKKDTKCKKHRNQFKSICKDECEYNDWRKIFKLESNK